MEGTEGGYSDYGEHDNDSFYEDYPTLCDKQDVRSFGGAFLPVIYGLVLILGLAGNSLVVAVYLRYKKLRTMTDVYILNLAAADLLLLFTLPFWAADAIHGWQLGAAMCKITSILYDVNFGCGMFFLACISVDRYLAMASARGPPAAQGRRRMAVCLTVWVAAFLLGVPDSIFTTVKHTSSRKACIAVYSTNMAVATKAALEILEVVLAFLLPFLVMLFCYSRLARAIRRLPEARQGRKRHVFRVLLAVVAAFLATQLPYNVVKFWRAMDIIYNLVTQCENSKSLDRAMQVTESLALTHSCLNPVLYAFLGTSFRQYLLKIMKAFGQRRRTWNGREQPRDVEISLNSHETSEDTSQFTL